MTLASLRHSVSLKGLPRRQGMRSSSFWRIAAIEPVKTIRSTVVAFLAASRARSLADMDELRSSVANSRITTDVP